MHQEQIVASKTNEALNASLPSAATADQVEKRIVGFYQQHNLSQNVSNKANVSQNVSSSAAKGTAFLSKAMSSEDNATAEESDADASDSDEDGEEEEEKGTSSKMQTEKEKKVEKKMSKAKVAAMEKVSKAQAKVELLEAKVKKMNFKRAVLAEEKEYMEDEQGFKTNMAQRVTMVANETQTKALAEFLGGMWTEMRKFSSPFYKQHLEDEGEEVKVELKKHKAMLEDARDEEAAAKKELLELIEKEKEAKGEKTGEKEEEEEDEDDKEDGKDEDDEKEDKEDDEEKKGGEEKRKKAEATKEGPKGYGLAHSASSRTTAVVAGAAATLVALFV